MKIVNKIILFFALAGVSASVFSRTPNDSLAAAKPAILKSVTFDGVIKTKLETSTEAGVVRFNVRNSRIGLRGNIGSYLSYRMQVELSNEGVLAPLDLFGTLKPTKDFSFLFGQQSVPFENNYIITPAEMMFANRAFVGKYFTPGSRDIGAAAQYRFRIGNFPLETQAGVFNGGKINNPQWTDKPSYAFRLLAGSMDGFRSTAKIYKYNDTKRDSTQRNLLLWGADVRYTNKRLRVESEVMNRHSYPDSTNLFGAYIQGGYMFPLRKTKVFHYLTPAARWDAMGYNVWNKGFDVQRITAGIHFGLSFIPYESLIRIDYEHYFLRNKNRTFPDFDNRDAHVADNKITIELLVRF